MMFISSSFIEVATNDWHKARVLCNKRWRLETNCHSNCSEVTREKGPHFLCHSSHLLLSSTIVTSSVGSSWRLALWFPWDKEFEGTKRQQVMRKGWVWTGGTINRKLVIHRNASCKTRLLLCIVHRTERELYTCNPDKWSHTSYRTWLERTIYAKIALVSTSLGYWMILHP